MSDKNILIKVERECRDDCTVSDVFVDGKLFCKAIEDPKRDVKVHGKTCIPDGEYLLGSRVSPSFSPKFGGRRIIWVKGVAGFNYILIHWGNTVLDTEGCLIVGNKLGKIGDKTAVLSSKVTHEKLYEATIQRIEKGGQYIQYITVKDNRTKQ